MQIVKEGKMLFYSILFYLKIELEVRNNSTSTSSLLVRIKNVYIKRKTYSFSESQKLE